MDIKVACLCVLAIVNSAAVNIEVHVSSSTLVSSGYMPGSGSARSYGVYIPVFLRKLHTIFHSGWINLHSHQQCKRFPGEHFLFVDFLVMVILTSVR